MNRVAPAEARAPTGLPPADLAAAVERRVEASPEAVAVTAGSASLTYAELDGAANRLARRLQSLGAGPEALVGVCVERSLDMAVGLLAVLKAGGACLPLDPSYPVERLRVMLADAGPAVVLTQAHLADLLAAARSSPSTRLVDLDAERAALAAGPGDRPERETAPDRLAYVIYTSGSTGEPRGVMLPHRALVNHCLAAADLYELGPADRVVQFCSIGFDVSVEELFPTWAAGGRVVLRSGDVPILGRAWLNWLQAEGVSVLNLPTAYWHEWVRDLDALGERVPDGVRLVIVGGERALGSAYRAWRRVGGDRPRWLNAYGPTEAAVMATVYEARGGEPGQDQEGDPPIGRPLGGATVHLLDPAGRPVAPGEVGELHIGGAGLAWGYLNQPQLTAERFVADPFSGRPGARMYRTGDLARLRPDGDLEFAGRRDRQVKVAGGFRVEPGEVEVALRSHPGVGDAVVAPNEDPAGRRRLVAYVLAAADTAPAASLRGHLAARLPAYMVPAAFVHLSAFPLTANGKVDHAALAALAADRPARDYHPVAPRTPTEEALTAIWSEVLGTEVGVTDDLFELGGHSLLATQIAARVREAFAAPVPLGALLAKPTVADLARLLEAEDARPDPGAPPLVARRQLAGARIPLSLPQEQMWALETSTGPIANQNVTASHRFGHPVDPDTLLAALRRLVARHDSLRASFSTSDGRPYQQVAETVPVELVTTDLTTADDPEAELAEHVRRLDLEPFDLNRPPLFRARLFHLDGERGVAAVTFDHLVCDGPSAYIFLSELATTYEDLAQGLAPRLRPPRVQYGDFAGWQRDWLTEERLAAQLDYWRHALAGAPLGPALPFDRVPAEPSRRIASLPVAVGPETYQLLTELAQASGASVFIVGVAAVSALLSRQGGRSDVVLSTTLSGRQRAELEGVIGNFAGTGRLRTDLSGDPTFAEAVARARETAIGLFEHQDIPFSRVREAVLPGLAPRGGGPPLELLPVEFQYFRAARDRWVPGANVVERPGPDRGPDELYFRGQLHPLSITLLDDGTELWGDVSYKRDFYDEATMRRLAEGLHQLIGAAVTDPGARLSALPAG